MRRILTLCILVVMISSIMQISANPVVAESSSGWGEATLLEIESLGNVLNFHIAMNDKDEAFTVWSQDNGTSENVWASRFDIAQGWSQPVLIENNDSNAGMPKIVIDNGGNATAVWRQYNNSIFRYELWFNRYQAEIGWSSPILLVSNSSSHVSSLDMAIDSDGNIILVWEQSLFPLSDIYSMIYENGIGWGIPTLIEYNNTAYLSSPVVSLDANGNAIAAWHQSIFPSWTIWANRYEKGIGWGTARQIGPLAASGIPVLEVDRAGNAICVWHHMNASGFYEIWTNYYDVSSGWGTASILAASINLNLIDPDISMDKNGNAIVVWDRWGGSLQDGIWAQYYDIESGWDVATFLVATAYSPKVAMDQDGNAIVIFIYDDGNYANLWAIRYDASIGWGISELIGKYSLGDVVLYPDIEINGIGNAIAVWRQMGVNYNNLWAIRYAAPDTEPPVLTLTEPMNNEIFSEPVITVSGTTEPGVNLNINGVLAAVEQDGSFSLEIALQEGDNTITAVAIDAAGNPTTASITVSYENPIADLQDELNSLRNELISLRNELNATRNELNSTEDQLYAVESDLEKIDMWRMLSIAGMIAAIVALIIAFIALMQAARERRRMELGPPGKETSPPPQAQQPSVPSAPSAPKAPDKLRPKSRP